MTFNKKAIMKRAKSRQDRPISPDPSATPTEAPAIEPAQDLTPATHHIDIQAIAPDYEFILITIRDGFGIESRWLTPADRHIGKEGLEALIQHHIRASQSETRRN